MSTKHLRPEWTERLSGAASARARHAALVAGTQRAARSAIVRGSRDHRPADGRRPATTSRRSACASAPAAGPADAMDIQLGTQRILVLEDRESADVLRQRAMDKRSQAFASGIGSLLSRPKAEEIELVTSQRRLEAVLARRRPGDVRLRAAPRLLGAGERARGPRGQRPRRDVSDRRLAGRPRGPSASTRSSTAGRT